MAGLDVKLLLRIATWASRFGGKWTTIEVESPRGTFPSRSKSGSHFRQSRGLFWHVFGKTGRSHNGKPFEYVRAGFAAHFDISLNVREAISGSECPINM